MCLSANVVQARLGKEAEVYRLLADCFLRPGSGLRQTVHELAHLVEELKPDLLDLVEAMAGFLGVEGPDQELALDHARLFVGPFSLLAPPYGSVYLEQEGQVMGLTTAAAREFYLAEGLDVAENFNHPPDHITVELEFIHYLSARRAELLAQGDRTEAGRLGRLQQRFIDLQLRPWLGSFVDRVGREAGTVFYSSLAKLTKALIEDRRPRSAVFSIPAKAGGQLVTV